MQVVFGAHIKWRYRRYPKSTKTGY